MSDRPEVIGAKPLCLDCHKAGIVNCSHFDNCDGKWVYVLEIALRERLVEKVKEWKPDADALMFYEGDNHGDTGEAAWNQALKMVCDALEQLLGETRK